MRPEILSKLENFGDFKGVLIFIILPSKHGFQIEKPEANSFGDGLSSVSGKENIFLCEHHKETYYILSKILYFVNHQEMHNLGRFEHTDFDLTKNVIHKVVLVV